MKAEEQFVRICKAIGRRAPVWVQGAGGNVSKKISDGLQIKASGIRLDKMGTPNTSVIADDSALRTGILNGSINTEIDYARCIAAMTRGTSGARASMETGFHSILPSEWVLHFHPIIALIMAEHPTWSHNRGIQVVEYFTPGLNLSRSLIAHRQARIIVLQNHGVILQGSDPNLLLQDWIQIEEEFAREFDLNVKMCDADVYGPLRIYFPDTAVFIGELIKSLVPVSGGYRLTAPPAGDRGKAVTELWTATQLLYREHPALAEISADEAGRLAGLPTEEYRRQHGS